MRSRKRFLFSKFFWVHREKSNFKKWALKYEIFFSIINSLSWTHRHYSNNWFLTISSYFARSYYDDIAVVFISFLEYIYVYLYYSEVKTVLYNRGTTAVSMTVSRAYCSFTVSAGDYTYTFYLPIYWKGLYYCEFKGFRGRILMISVRCLQQLSISVIHKDSCYVILYSIR